MNKANIQSQHARSDFSHGGGQETGGPRDWEGSAGWLAHAGLVCSCQELSIIFHVNLHDEAAMHPMFAVQKLGLL